MQNVPIGRRPWQSSLHGWTRDSQQTAGHMSASLFQCFLFASFQSNVKPLDCQEVLLDGARSANWRMLPETMDAQLPKGFRFCIMLRAGATSGSITARSVRGVSTSGFVFMVFMWVLFASCCVCFVHSFLLTGYKVPNGPRPWRRREDRHSLATGCPVDQAICSFAAAPWFFPQSMGCCVQVLTDSLGYYFLFVDVAWIVYCCCCCHPWHSCSIPLQLALVPICSNIRPVRIKTQ